MGFRRTVATALFALIVAPAARADGLRDLRVALGTLGGHAAIRGSYEVRVARSAMGRFANTSRHGAATVDVAADAAGYRIELPRPVVEAVSRERLEHRRDADRPTPTAAAMATLDAVEVAEAVHHAPALLRLIDGATVEAERAGVWEGAPARELVLRLPDPQPGADGFVRLGRRSMVRNRLTLWLGSDGVPLAGELDRASKVSFLILRGHFEERHRWRYARHGDRLVVARYELEGSGSGMGQNGSESTVAVLRVARG